MPQTSRAEKTKNMTTAALIAAVYTTLTLVLAPISFGYAQIRVSEALTILAVYSPMGASAVTLGCFLSNLVGTMTGANLLGMLDVFLGTLATGVAAFLSYRLRNIRFRGLPVLSTLPPVVLNALIVGGEITYLAKDVKRTAGLFLFNALFVGVGQVIACVILGLGLFTLLNKVGLDKFLISPSYTNP